MVVITVLTIISCKKDKYYLYNDAARLQFGPAPNLIYQTFYNLADTLKPFTFYYDDAAVTQDTVYFDIYAIGGKTNNDRTFTLQQEQLPNTFNAVAGTHYIAFSNPQVSKHYVIKAGTVHTKLPVVLLRDASLKTSTPKLKFKIVSDGNFALGELSNIWRKIEFTDRLSQPSSWDATITQFGFGKYSVVKHAFLIQETGEKWDNEFITKVYFGGGLLSYYQLLAKTALVDYNNAHPGMPLKDETGELVIFP